MPTFSQSRTLVACMGAALLGGVSALAILAGNVVTVADAGPAVADNPPSWSGQEFPICHTSTAGRAPMLLRLAQTEVPRAEMSAASSTPAFADTEPPLWPGLGTVSTKITTTNERAQAYFDQGLRLAY